MPSTERDPGSSAAHPLPSTPSPASDAPLSAPDAVLERVAGQRLRLQGVANALAAPLDPQAVAAQVLEAACTGLGAPQGWVVGVTAEGEAVEILAAVGYKPELLAPWTRVPLAVPVPMTEVVRTGRPVFHADRTERWAAFPALAVPHTDQARSEGSAVVPLAVGGATVGAMALAWPEPRRLDVDERWFLESLAAQGAQALERARLFAALQERDARLRFALEASGTGTWEWDLVRDRLDWSPQMLRMHGIAEDGRPPSVGAWLELVHPDDRRGVREAIRACLRTDGPVDAEFRVRVGGEERWIHAVGRSVRGADGHPVRILGTSREITDRRRAEAERDRMLQAEREAARLRDAFIGVVSHELRTPITTIFGGTRVLARRWHEMEDIARDDLLEDVAAEADRLYRLVEDLLVLTRVERGTLDIGDEPVHLARLVTRVVASERARWPELRIDTDLPPDLPSASGEETYVEQVLRNLVGNAAKYGGPASRVTVAAAAAPEGIVLEVLDEGPGLDPVEADRLFELFYRSPVMAGKAGGAGIGLFVCRELVAAMGGTIEASTRPGGGAAFRVVLPRYEDDGVP